MTRRRAGMAGLDNPSAASVPSTVARTVADTPITRLFTRQCPLDALFPLLRRHAPHFQGEREVLAHGHMGEEGIVLKDHPDPAPARRQILHRAAIDADDSGCGRLKARQHHQDRGLTRPRRTQKGDELAFLDAEVEIFDHQCSPVVALAYSLELDVPVVVGGGGGSNAGNVARGVRHAQFGHDTPPGIVSNAAYRSIAYHRLPIRRFSSGACWLLS